MTKCPFFLATYTFANDHLDESRGTNAILEVNVLGFVETVTSIIPVVSDPHEGRHTSNVFKAVCLGSHRVSTLGRCHPIAMRLSDPRDWHALTCPPGVPGWVWKPATPSAYSFQPNVTFSLSPESTRFLDVYLFLFDDFLLITKTKRSRKVSCRYFQIRLLSTFRNVSKYVVVKQGKFLYIQLGLIL